MKKMNIIKLGAALAIALAAYHPQQAFATARKGAELLTQGGSAQIRTSAPGATVTELKCAKCKTVYGTAPDTGRGSVKSDRIVAKHLCTECRTRVETAGVGKQAKRVVTHLCQKCGSELLPHGETK